MLPTGDLSRMQAAQQAHMPDTCHRAVYSSSADDYGAIIEVWTENTTDIPCGIEQGNQRQTNEKIEDNMTVVTYDAIVRLPISLAEIWDIKDRLILTKRFGVAITPIAYGIVAPVMRGPSGIRLLLQKIEV